MSTESVTPSKHLVLCCPFLLPPSVLPRIRVFSEQSLFASGGPNIGASVSVSVLPINIQRTSDFRVTNFTAGEHFHCLMHFPLKLSLFRSYPVVSLFDLPHRGNHCLKTEYKRWNSFVLIFSRIIASLPPLPVPATEGLGPCGWWIVPKSLTVPGREMRVKITSWLPIGSKLATWEFSG